jgi:hypothetical protein
MNYHVLFWCETRDKAKEQQDILDWRKNKGQGLMALETKFVVPVISVRNRDGMYNRSRQRSTFGRVLSSESPFENESSFVGIEFGFYSPF